MDKIYIVIQSVFSFISKCLKVIGGASSGAYFLSQTNLVLIIFESSAFLGLLYFRDFTAFTFVN